MVSKQSGNEWPGSRSAVQQSALQCDEGTNVLPSTAVVGASMNIRHADVAGRRRNERTGWRWARSARHMKRRNRKVEAKGETSVKLGCTQVFITRLAASFTRQPDLSILTGNSRGSSRVSGTRRLKLSGTQAFKIVSTLSST